MVHNAQNNIILNRFCVHIAENHIISAALDRFQTYAPDIAVSSFDAIRVATDTGISALCAPVIAGNRNGLERSEHAEETNQRENKQSGEENDSGLHNEYLPFNQWACCPFPMVLLYHISAKKSIRKMHKSTINFTNFLCNLRCGPAPRFSTLVCESAD